MSSDIPKTHRAVVATADKTVTVSEKELPKLEEGDVLVDIKAVTLNPTDWKHVTFALIPEGSSVGSDFAGTVAHAAGEWKQGDRVAGFTRGGYIDNSNGSFAQYIKSPSPLLWKIPQQTSFEDAASMGGIGLSTAIYCLCHKLGLPRWDHPSKEPVPFLIWSGATSVGDFAVQLGQILNLETYVTASPKHHERLKSLGAKHVFDYKDKDVVSKIKEASGGAIKYGLDTISEHGSTLLASQCFGDNGGKLATLLPVKQEGDGWPSNVEIIHCLIYAVLKEGKDDYDFISAWNKDLPKFIEEGKIKGNPLKVMDGGLDNIHEGLEYLKSGKASGEKLAYKL